MIESFHDRGTEDVFDGLRTRNAIRSCPVVLWKIARQKPAQLDSAQTLNDLRVPPGNRLEALRGDRAGQHGIRINQQYRICFTWTARGPANVEVVDYH